jgi:dTDP-glucose pyrophosphorylase
MYTYFDKCQVLESQKLVDVMLALDRGAAGIALVVDGEDHLVGTLTDGDVRRALLDGATLASPLAKYMQRTYVSTGTDTGRVSVLDLMQSRGIQQVPVVDERGRLRGLHLLRELIGCEERENWAVVMAGGKGTRLRPITDILPKPMIRVAGRPILERIVLHLVGHGFRRIFLSVNYMAHVVENHFGDGSGFGCRIEYLREEKPLGTGGALSLLPEPPAEPVVVMNGDLVTQADLGKMLRFHKEGGYEATVGVREYCHAIPFGCVEVSDGRLALLEEKPVMRRMVNTGIYVVNPGTLRRLRRGEEVPMTKLFQDLLDRGEPIGAFQILEDWIDVGQQDQLQAARTGAAS